MAYAQTYPSRGYTPLRSIRSIRSIRKALRGEFGRRSYRIDVNGDIHVRGEMPNSDECGWYLFGRVDRTETMWTLGL